ncbi:uncharacterized protein LOC104584349 [Brachypodium distachyon]|nr:uncharacterized protein LOC104584349 [Brachypodium distachyon]|eukprot:XP_010236996.2 uncharacterized protein LOC104584349 [Brachypodium distachyon]
MAAAVARVHHPQVHHRVSARGEGRHSSDTATMAAGAVRAHSHHHRAASAPAAVVSRTEDRRLRRSPLPVEQRLRRRGRAPGCGEVAGGTAAGCAAVSCCLPLAVVELVVLAAVRAPAALCQRSISKRRRAARRKETEDDLAIASAPASAGDASPTSVALAKNSALEAANDDEAWPCWSLLKPAAVAAAAEELAEAEEEVWARFCGNGFWRSPEETW